MLKSPMPVCFYSIALIVVTPTSANPDKHSINVESKTVHVKRDARVFSPNNKIAYTQPDKKGLKFVNSYIRNNDDNLTDVRERSEAPFTVIDSVLTRYHLPLELKYLAVIESELKPTAVSRVGAEGTWQLMRGTAHVLGLKVNKQTDERKDLAKSTRAAALYLRDLHHQFKDWLLVLAAYNGGPLPVLRAMHKARSRDFWALQKFLPAESRMHVKKFIATTKYFEQEEAKPAVSQGVAVMTSVSAETVDQKFNHLMRESATSLQVSNGLLEQPRSADEK
jgi:membrane-bound lytic murein transglycosylase MltF